MTHNHDKHFPFQKNPQLFLENIFDLFNQYPTGAFYWNFDEDFVLINNRLKEILHLSYNVIPRKTFKQFLAPGYKNTVSHSHRHIKKFIYICPPSKYPNKQSRLPMVIRKLTDAENRPIGINGVEYPEHLFPLTKIFNIGNKFQQIALRANKREEILQALCDLFVSEGNYQLAWFGLADYKHNRVLPLAWSGEGDYLNHIQITLDDTPTGKGPTATAIKHHRIFICRDTENDPKFKPWREEALKRGFFSTLSYPFYDEFQNLITLNLYAREKYHFDEHEIQLIKHLVNDMRFSLQVLYHRNALQQSIEKLKQEHWKFTQFLNTSLEGFLLIDKHGIIQDVNPAYCRLTGYDRQELIHQSLQKVESDASLQEIKQQIHTLFAQKQGRYFTKHRTKDGQQIYLEISYCTIETGNQQFLAYFIRNITEEKRLLQQLEKSEKQYRELIENSPFIYGILQHNKLVYLNSTGQKQLSPILGPNLIGKDKKDLMPPAEYERSEQRVTNILAGKPVSYPVEITLYDARNTPHIFELYVVYKDLQNPPVLHFIMNDITEKKKSETALIRKDRILEAVSLAATEFFSHDFWEADINQVLAYLGQATDADRVYIFKNHRHESGDLLTSQLFEWVNESIPPTIESPELQNVSYKEVGFTRWVQFLKKGKIISGNVSDFPPAEQEFLLAQDIQSILVVPIFVDDHWWGFIGFDNCHSVFQWSNAEIEVLKIAATLIGASLKRSRIEKDRNLLAQALKNIHDAVIITDIELNIKYTNQAFEKLFGYSSSSQLNFTSLVTVSEGASDMETILHHTRQSGWQGEVQCHKADGTTFTAHLSTASIQTKTGAPQTLIFIVRDISEYKSLQHQFQQAQKMEAIGRLAGGVAHDFNNLLTIINGYTQLLLSQIPENAPFHNELQQIFQAGERASELTNQLLAFSRKQMVHPRVYSLNTLVQELEKMIRRLIGEDIEIVTHLDHRAGNIKTDRGQFQQILLNLVVNARDAMPNGGRLIIETDEVIIDKQYTQNHVGAREGIYSRLRVRDTGTGIPDDVLPHIFEPFFTTKSQGKGTGLGLATVYGIVKQNKGYIWVESTPGKGTTFEIFFPKVQEPTTKQDQLLTRLPQIRSNSHGTILVVEDDPGVRLLIKNILETAGYTIIEAQNGAAALKLITSLSNSIDLVVTDIVMPEMSGTELGEKIQEISPKTKLLYMSGYSDELTKATSTEIHAQNFIKKPFTPGDLLGKINELFSL